MSDLSPDAKRILSRALRDGGDDPSPRDRARIRSRVASRIAAASVGAAAGAATAASTAAASAPPAAAGAAGASGAAATGAIAAGAGSVVAGGGSVAVSGATGVIAKVVASIALAGAIGAGTASFDLPPPIAAGGTPAPAASAIDVSTPAALPHANVANAPSPTASAIREEPIETTAPSANAVVANPAAAAPPPSPSAGADTTAPPHHAPPAATVGVELVLLRAAQRALAEHDAAKALVLLDEHARRFPHGALVEERDAARVLALCDLGRRAEAHQAGAGFLAAFPQSPYAERVGACAAGDDAP